VIPGITAFFSGVHASLHDRSTATTVGTYGRMAGLTGNSTTSDGDTIESRGSFETLTDCMADARSEGYEAGSKRSPPAGGD
jgi:hypothetical protein